MAHNPHPNVPLDIGVFSYPGAKMTPCMMCDKVLQAHDMPLHSIAVLVTLSMERVMGLSNLSGKSNTFMLSIDIQFSGVAHAILETKHLNLLHWPCKKWLHCGLVQLQC